MIQALATSFDWGAWLYGLFAATIAGGAQAAAAALTLNVTDPQHFNATTSAFWRQIGIQFLVGAALSFFLYLKKTSLPEVRKTEVVGTKTVVAPTGETTTTVVQKTTTVETPTETKVDSKPEATH